MQPSKSYADVFFFYDAEWSGQELFTSYLNDPVFRYAAMHELLKTSFLVDNMQSDLHAKVQYEFDLRVVAAKKDELYSRAGRQDYFDYLFTTIKPSDESLWVGRYSLEQHDLLHKKHNL